MVHFVILTNFHLQMICRTEIGIYTPVPTLTPGVPGHTFSEKSVEQHFLNSGTILGGIGNLTQGHPQMGHVDS